MATLGALVQFLGGLAGLVCFVVVLVRMFQAGQVVLGVACILLLFCFSLGYWIAFVYGWMRAREWGMSNLMTIWTGAVILIFVGAALRAAGGGTLVPGL